MSAQRIRREPTHVLTVEVPIHIDDEQPDFDPWRDAIRTVLAVSRAAYDGVICGDPMVWVRDERKPADDEGGMRRGC